MQVGSEIFFTASDPANGEELWKSDGTEAGTVLVKDIRIGTNGSYPEQSDQRQRHAVLSCITMAMTRVKTAENFGRATALRQAPCWSRIFALERTVQIQAELDQRQRHAVL